MSEVFTASNGVDVERADGGDLCIFGSRRDFICHEHQVALREFFLHERDQELGRWRDPENPDRYVRHGSVGPRAGRGERRWLTIVDERTELSYSVAEDYDSAGMGDLWGTAKRYFAAHPVPKPWHDAKDGEIWEVKPRFASAEPRAVVANKEGGSFVDPRARLLSIPVRSPGIESARRIWPEVSDE